MWLQVTNLNVTDLQQNCPGQWLLVNSPEDHVLYLLGVHQYSLIYLVCLTSKLVDELQDMHLITKWVFIVANCPEISETVPDSYLCPRRVLKTCFNLDCPGIALIVPVFLPVWPHPHTSYDRY